MDRLAATRTQMKVTPSSEVQQSNCHIGFYATKKDGSYGLKNKIDDNLFSFQETEYPLLQKLQLL